MKAIIDLVLKLSDLIFKIYDRFCTYLDNHRFQGRIIALIFSVSISIILAEILTLITILTFHQEFIEILKTFK